MTTPVVSSMAMLPSATNNVPATRAYRTKTSFVAVQFDQAGKGRIVFLPEGAKLHVVGPSSCLPEGFEVMLDNQLCSVFESDLLSRCAVIYEPIRARGCTVAACA